MNFLIGVFLVSIILMCILLYAFDIPCRDTYQIKEHDKMVNLISQRIMIDKDPIDFVISWAGPSRDTNRDMERRKYAPKMSHNRFADHDEIFICITNILVYASSFLGNIHVVYPGSCVIPDHLSDIDKKVKWVKDSSILPSVAIPSFNSHAIETMLDHIPGLSERFIYSCDDMFLIRKVTKDKFFDVLTKMANLPYTNKFKCVKSKKRKCSKGGGVSNKHHSAWHNVGTLLTNKDISVTYPVHTMIPLTKTGYLNARALFGDEFYQTTLSRIRSHDDIHPIGIVINVMFNNNHAIWTTDLTSSMFMMKDRSITRICRNANVIRSRGKPWCDVVCVKDHTKDDRDNEYITKWLKTNFLSVGQS